MLAAVALLTAGSASAQGGVASTSAKRFKLHSGDSSSDVVTGGAWAGKARLCATVLKTCCSVVDPKARASAFRPATTGRSPDHVGRWR